MDEDDPDRLMDTKSLQRVSEDIKAAKSGVDKVSRPKKKRRENKGKQREESRERKNKK